MDEFIHQYNDRISGVLSCFDRIVFKGYLPLGWSGAMERLIGCQGLLLKDFKRFVTMHSERIKQHAEAVAQKAGRPFLYVSSSRIRKEDWAREIAERDGITEGLICVFRVLEPCQSFKLVPGEGRPRLVNAQRKCLCYYFYVIDREFGLMHIRIQSWFPLVVQVCLNGHEWLARKLDRHGIDYRKQDNAFLWIEDPQRAQRFADRFEKKNWPRILSAFARKINPLLKGLLSGMDYYWVVDQAEYATDVMFRSASSLKDLYENLLRHATLCFGAFRCVDLPRSKTPRELSGRGAFGSQKEALARGPHQAPDGRPHGGFVRRAVFGLGMRWNWCQAVMNKARKGTG